MAVSSARYSGFQDFSIFGLLDFCVSCLLMTRWPLQLQASGLCPQQEGGRCPAGTRFSACPCVVLKQTYVSQKSTSRSPYVLLARTGPLGTPVCRGPWKSLVSDGKARACEGLGSCLSTGRPWDLGSAMCLLLTLAGGPEGTRVRAEP